MRKKVLISLLFYLLSYSSIFSASKNVYLPLPVRVIEEKHLSSDLGKNNFRLFINDKQKEIVNLIQRKRSLSSPPELGRNFVLSFLVLKMTHKIENAISYLITEIINSNDSLIVLTPVKAYRLTVSGNKEKMIMDITELLHRDCQVYEKNRSSPEKNLENQIAKMKTTLTNFPLDRAGINTYKAINHFLLTFPKNFSDFKQLFLIPNLNEYQQIKDILATRQGEKWWIHFQHRESLKLVHSAREAMYIVNNYVNYMDGLQPLARAMKYHLSYFKKQLLFSDSFPTSDFLDIFLGHNIGFNTVIWGNIQTTESDTFIQETSELEGIFSEISSLTGGKTVITKEPEMGLSEIIAHSDHFYELICDFDGRIEEKRIQVLLDDKNKKLSYKNKFSKKEIESWIHTLAEKSVEIIDFSIVKNQVKFLIKIFKQEKEKKYDLLKVRMSLFDKYNLMVFANENTLRASKNKVAISIPIPIEHHGEFKLSITVFDLLANTLTSQDHHITLN